MSKSRVIINDKMPSFRQNLVIAMDNCLREVSNDILIESRNRVPFDKGHLRAQSWAMKVATLMWRIDYFIEYASYQERGERRDGSHKVTRYTTPGTGAHYLEDTGDEYTKNKLPGKWRKYARMVRA